MAEDKKSKLSLDRIPFFSDAVMAITITLLVIEIGIHEIQPENVASELPNAVVGLIWPEIFGYVLGFLVVGLIWILHHEFFRFIKKYDTMLLWLNIVLLLFVGFVPVSISVISDYGSAQPAILLYATNIVLGGVMQLLIWWYATSKRRLVDKDLDSSIVKDVMLRTAISPAVFLMSIGISYLNTLAAMLSWMAIFVFLTGIRIYKKISKRNNKME